MKCPRCKNQNFKETEDVRKPLKNIGGKECYDTVDFRRYVCLQCGHSFITAEKFDREIKVQHNNQIDIFKNKRVA